MNLSYQSFYDKRCRCNEEVSIISNSSDYSEGRPLKYPIPIFKKEELKLLGFNEKDIERLAFPFNGGVFKWYGEELEPIDEEELEFNAIETKLETFQIKYEKKLSLIATFILNSFRNKYIYYAIDDILYSLKSNPIERDNLLTIIYSPVLSLQNNFSVNFFDIWIKEIYINEVSKVNKFIIDDSKNLEQFNYITIKLLYKLPVKIKKQDTLW